MANFMERTVHKEVFGEAAMPSGDYIKYSESCDSDLHSIITTDGIVKQSCRQSLWTCLKVSFESTVAVVFLEDYSEPLFGGLNSI